MYRGAAEPVRKFLRLGLTAPDGSDLTLPVEADITILRPSDMTAVVLSAKTTLKERLHIAVMWRLVLEAAKDPGWSARLGIKPVPDIEVLRRLRYCFVTADLGERGDLLSPRNLIKADASLFDCFFAARDDLPHLERVIGVDGRKAIFYRLSAIYEYLQLI